MKKCQKTPTEEMLSRFNQWFSVVMLFIEKLLQLNLTVEQVQRLLKDRKHPFWIAFNEATKLLAPPQIQPQVEVVGANPCLVPQVMFKAEDTNLEAAIDLSQRFAKKVFGVEIDLRKLFNFPTELPWKDVMVVFDPDFDNQEAIKEALNSQNLAVWEEADVMKYSGSKRLEQPTLYIIENSITPSADTLGKQAKSPDQLNADGRLYLDLRNYALAFGQRYFGFQDYLDHQTWTWFPKNRLPGSEVARGYWYSDRRKVGFDWSDSGRVDSDMGARLAISVPLNLNP